jgi:hypothetical protein
MQAQIRINDQGILNASRYTGDCYEVILFDMEYLFLVSSLRVNKEKSSGKDKYRC